MKNIWIINQYASHLETRHLELSTVFAEKGCRVTVITSTYHHGKREYIYPETLRHVERAENVHYIYLKAKPEYKSNGLKRVLSWFGFCALFLQSMKEIEKIGGKPDFVIASSAPPTVWELGLHCAKKYGAKYIAEFRDIWPLSLVEIQGLSPKHPAVIFFGILEKRAYRKADAVVSTMPYAYKHVMELTKVPRAKIHWMPNGINTKNVDRMLEDAPTLPEGLDRYLSENWCAVYTGSIAKCESVDFLVEAFRRLSDTDIHLAIIGEGGERDNIQALVDEYALGNVQLFEAVSKEQVPVVLQKAGCCVVASEELPIYQYGLSMNKLSEYLYSGRPTVFACGFDNVVKDAGHFNLPFNDAGKLADTIKTVHGLSQEQIDVFAAAGREHIICNYDYANIGSKYLEMMESL